MTRGPQQQRLREFLDRANQEELRSAGRQWSQGQNLLMDISAQLERMSGDMGRSSDEEFQGQTADAARMSFVASARAMAAKAAQLEQGADAFEQSATAVDQAIAEREALAQNDGAQPPTRPSTPPGSTDPADVRAQSSYDTANAAYWDRYHADERRATDAITALDQTHTASAEVFKSIHGEPDPVAPAGAARRRHRGRGRRGRAHGRWSRRHDPDFDPADGDGGGNGGGGNGGGGNGGGGGGDGGNGGGGDGDGGPPHVPVPPGPRLFSATQRPDRAHRSLHAHDPWHRHRDGADRRRRRLGGPAPAAASRPGSAPAWPAGSPEASRRAGPSPGSVAGTEGRVRRRTRDRCGGPRGAGSSVLGRGTGIAGVGNGAGTGTARQRTRGTRRVGERAPPDVAPAAAPVGGELRAREARSRARARGTGRGSGRSKDRGGRSEETELFDDGQDWLDDDGAFEGLID